MVNRYIKRNNLTLRALLRTLLLVILLSVVLSVFLSLTACSAKPVIGDIDERATVALIRYETIDKDLSGIVYREVLDLERLIAESKQPLLFAFYTPNDPVNTELIPLLEQMADDYKDRAGIVFVNSEANPSLAAIFSLQKTPHFSIVSSGVIRQSAVGFDDTTRSGLDQMVKPYLS